jgi:hypothetical protein
MYSKEVKINDYEKRIYISVEQISEKYINGFNYTFRWKIKDNDRLCLTVASKNNLSADEMFNIIEDMLYYDPKEYEKGIRKYFENQEYDKCK